MVGAVPCFVPARASAHQQLFISPDPAFKVLDNAQRVRYNDTR
jgi:hypothetical protein